MLHFIFKPKNPKYIIILLNFFDSQNADKLAAEVAQAVFDLAGGVGARPELPA